MIEHNRNTRTNKGSNGRRCIGYDPLFEQVTAGFAITSVIAVIFVRHVHVSLTSAESQMPSCRSR